MDRARFADGIVVCIYKSSVWANQMVVGLGVLLQHQGDSL